MDNTTWKPVRRARKKADEVELTLVGQKIGRRWYGIGRCYVGEIEGLALKAGAQRYIVGTVDEARAWFRGAGLTAEQANEMVTEGLAKLIAQEAR